MENQTSLRLSSEAITYTWRQLAHRTGISDSNQVNTGFEKLDVAIYYARPDQIQVNQPSIIVTPCSDSAWWTLLERTPHTLHWLPHLDVIPRGMQLPFEDSIPVLFWGEGYENGHKPFAEQREDGTVIFYADIVAATFFMLSRWEETVTAAQDKHGRFPAAASVAYKQGFLDRPIIDEYALILQAWLKMVLPGWIPEPRKFSIKLTHDIDSIRRLRNLYSAILVFGADLFKRHNPLQAWQTCLEYLWQNKTPPEQITYFQGIYFLAELSAEYGLDSAFYFIAAKPKPPDGDYDINSALMRKCIESLRQQGFEIGLHPSYHTLNNPDQLAIEKTRLDEVLGETEYGGRQHYLRFQAPDTWRHWESVGLTYDSTVGYADHEGFRCGTCHPFQPFDITEDRMMNLWEWPLIVMDRTLHNYQKLTPEQGKQRVLKLAQQCRQVGGTFTLLWHNSSLVSEWQPWADVYQQVISNGFVHRT